jgi:long-subunit acyl-CoA synthetase (AMP-forming)
MAEIRSMAAYLKATYPEGSQIGLFSKNTAWWIMAEAAIQMAGHVSVPLYPTLTADTIRYTLEHSESVCCIVGKLDGYKAMAPGIPEDMPRIVTPLAPDQAVGDKWDDLVAKTEPMTDKIVRGRDEMATIVYTSGSTGRPKGVMLSFGAMADSGNGLIDLLDINKSDRYLSYLPLSHVLERYIVGTACVLAGCHIYFAESLDTFLADLQRSRPTMFVSVPRLWLKFKQGVNAKMPDSRLNLLLKIPVLNNIIRKKILTQLGLAECRFAGSGSAPIPGEVIGWYRNLGLELLEAYGMSENFCFSHVNMLGRVKVGSVGEPYPGVQCRTSEEGEIQIKSPGNMMGYFKNPEATAEAFTEDGWLKTGDKGSIDAQNRLTITGRVKEIFKTSKGKYVAPAPIENRLVMSDDIEMACVMGSGQPQPHAVIMLSEDGRKRLAADPAGLKASLQQHLKAVNAQLDHHEHLQFLAITGEEWTIESGILTPTMKVKRRVLEDDYGPKADAWYATRESVIVA